MKPVYKGQCPPLLEEWAKKHPSGTWDEMRNDGIGKRAYKEAKQQLWQDQSGLCAYCECQLVNRFSHQWCVEHFHPKSDRSDNNWDFMWRNLLLVCTGGENSKNEHPLPENLSCSAAKNHKICDNTIINPLELPIFPPAFNLKLGTGEFLPNPEFCEKHPQFPGKLPTIELLKNTIDILNLNCNRLKTARLTIIRHIEKQKKELRDKRIPSNKGLSRLAERHLQSYNKFFSTRRACLGEVAEQYLMSVDFDPHSSAQTGTH